MNILLLLLLIFFLLLLLLLLLIIIIIIIIIIRWHYNPMRTFASPMDPSQSAPFADLSLQPATLHV